MLTAQMGDALYEAPDKINSVKNELINKLLK